MIPLQAPLQCPICASPDYTKVKVELPDGESYGVDVYKCALCSFKFLNRGRTPTRSPTISKSGLKNLHT